MTTNTRFSSTQFAIGLSALVLGLSGSAQAGPPLICHSLNIGQAHSLPWTAEAWSGTSADYNLKNLVPDTLAILEPGTPVLVRMETLRRATLYARKDPQAAKELFVKLYARATAAGSSDRSSALGWFDVGYLAECYKQWIGRDLPHMTDGLRLDPNPAAGLDGYALVKKAIALRGGDPQMEFAAALITLDGPARDRNAHVREAIAGSKSDPLLAANLSSHFVGSNSETIAEMFTKATVARN